MLGLLQKTFREIWLGTLLLGLGLLIAQVLLNFILPQIQEELSAVWLQLPFAKTLITALLGSDFGDQITAQMMQAIVWVHPVVLSLMWAHEIIVCTRIPAGEIDRGTVDVLLGWPVSRRLVYLCESMTWLITGLFLFGMAITGYLIGTQAMATENRPEFARILMVLVNLFAVYLSVGGVALLVSACSDRRGRAIGTIFGLVLASFLLNFLAQFWEPAKQFSFLGILNYYKPAQIIAGEGWPIHDMIVLGGVALTAWIIGGEVLARRSICTV